MIGLLLALIIVMILALSSIWANSRFHALERLPMQWSVSGKVNWTAPRRIALSFTPMLAAIVLGATAIAILASGDPRPGQEGLGEPVILLVGIVFITVHALHLRLIERSLG